MNIGDIKDWSGKNMRSSTLKLIIKIFYMSMLAGYQADFSFSP